MVTKAESKYMRISPFKIRRVMPLIKGEKVGSAMAILDTLNKKGAFCIRKVLKSAVANAKNKGYDEHRLFISNIIANPGPVLKRFRAASFGRATMIKKRTSHILIELDTKEKIIQNAKVKK